MGILEEMNWLHNSRGSRCLQVRIRGGSIARKHHLHSVTSTQGRKKCKCQDLIQTRTSIKAAPKRNKDRMRRKEERSLQQCWAWKRERVLGAGSRLRLHHASTSRRTPPSPPPPCHKTQGNLERLDNNIPFVYDVWSWTPSRKENEPQHLTEMRRQTSLSLQPRWLSLRRSSNLVSCVTADVSAV